MGKDSDQLLYVGDVFVRSVTTARAELYLLDPPANLPSGMSDWRGQLRGAVGWARRYDVVTGQENQLGIGDALELEVPGSDESFPAVITGMELLQPDLVSFRLNTAVYIAGFGRPPFGTMAGPTAPPEAGVREPRRPVPSSSTPGQSGGARPGSPGSPGGAIANDP